MEHFQNKYFGSLVCFLGIFVPISSLVAVKYEDVDELAKVLHGLQKASYIIGIVLSALALIFLAVFWKRPVIVLSQRLGTLAVVLVLLLNSLGAGFIPSWGPHSNITWCYIGTIIWFSTINALFALLTLKQYRIVRMYHIVRKGNIETGESISVFWPLVYVYSVAVLAGVVVAFSFVYPYQVAGMNACMPPPDAAGKIPGHGNLGYIMDVFYGIVHIILFLLAMYGRKFPSVCGDSSILFILGLVGLSWLVVDIVATGYDGNSNGLVALRIYSYAINLIIVILVYLFTIFDRVWYLQLTKSQVLALFLSIDDRFYDAMLTQNGAYDKNAENPEETMRSIRHLKEEAPVSSLPHFSWPQLRCLVNGKRNSEKDIKPHHDATQEAQV